MPAGTSKTMAYKNITLSYTTHNLTPGHSNTKPVLIFINCWCGSSALWSSQEPLYTAHPSILLDLPGHGQSSKPQNTDYSVEFSARAVISVLEPERVDKVILIGHSLSGQVATMVLRFLGEERVKGVVYVDSWFLMPIHTLSSLERAQFAEALRDDKFFWSTMPGSFSNSSQEVVDKIYKVMTSTPVHVRQSAICTDSIPHDWRPHEVYAETPCLLILAGVEEWDQRAWYHLPKLRMERWDGVSHFLFLDEPEKFNRRVEEFLRENGLE